MGRNPCCSKEGLNKGAWTAMEDIILTEYIKIHGEGKWRQLPKRAGLNRCGKSCRLRWLNYLRPDIKRGNITTDEEELIIRLHNLLGNRWSLIAGRIPGRTDNEIKNYWNTNIGRKLQNGSPSCPIITNLNSIQQVPNLKTQESHYPKYPTNNGSCVIKTKATRWTTKVTLTKEITHQQNEGNIERNVGDDDKMKGSPMSPSSESNNELFDFMADFKMDENFFSEFLKMDLPELSCSGNKMLEDNSNPSTIDSHFDSHSPPKSYNETPFSWGDYSLYDYKDFDFLPVVNFMEFGFDGI